MTPLTSNPIPADDMFDVTNVANLSASELVDRLMGELKLIEQLERPGRVVPLTAKRSAKQTGMSSASEQSRQDQNHEAASPDTLGDDNLARERIAA